MAQFVIALLNILMEPIQLLDKVSSYGLLENHKTANWSLRQGNEEVKKKTNILIFLLAPEESLFSNRNIGQICLNIYIYFLFFRSLLHRPGVRISLPFYDFLQVIIVLMQVYWEIRYHSTVCRRDLADILCYSLLTRLWFLSLIIKRE